MKKPESFNKDSSTIAKGVAILWLLVYHLFSENAMLEDMAVSYRPFTQDGFHMLAMFARVSVAIFVMITSYGLSKKIFDSDISIKESMSSSIRRLSKLMLNFFVFYLSVLAVFGVHFDLGSLYGDFPQGFIYFVTDALGLAETFGTPTLNMTWWYMNLAYELIILVPLVAYATKKIGYAIIPIVLFVPVIFTMEYENSLYLMTMAVGVAASYGDWFNRAMSVKISGLIKWIIGVVGTVLCVFIRENPVIKETYISVVDALIAMFIIWTAIELLAGIPVIRDCLKFIGKHSLNIFLVHSFFYLIVYRDFVYKFKPAIASFAILLLLSLLYSVILEEAKKFVLNGYAKIKGKDKA